MSDAPTPAGEVLADVFKELMEASENPLQYIEGIPHPAFNISKCDEDLLKRYLSVFSTTEDAQILPIMKLFADNAKNELAERTKNNNPVFGLIVVLRYDESYNIVVMNDETRSMLRETLKEIPRDSVMNRDKISILITRLNKCGLTCDRSTLHRPNGESCTYTSCIACHLWKLGK